MPLEQLVYTPTDLQTSQDNAPTFVVMVDDQMIKEYRKDKSIPLANVVESFEVFKYADGHGRSGKLMRPSKREIEDTFNTSNEDEVIEYIIANGELRNKAI